MSDAQYILNWWFLFFYIGVIGIPIAFTLFRKFYDGGYGFSKTLTILLISYSVFFFSTIRVLPFTRVSLFLVLLVFTGLNYVIFSRNKDYIINKLKQYLPLLILEEVLFTSGLLLWAYVRSFQPDINGLEKFMDYGFVNSVLQSQYLPPVDMWFAGKSINYYWFGHYITALLTKISDIPSAVTYNLMLGTILGLSMSGCFSIISNLLFSRFKLLRVAIIGGLVSAILLNFAGNFHTPYYIYQSGIEKYWYPDATRFIGYNPETEDKTIHEFPIYSYVVSDLHAHLLNLPFVLLFIALLYNFVSSIHMEHIQRSNNQASKSKQSSNNKHSIFKQLNILNLLNYNLISNWKLVIGNSPSNLLLLGFLLGAMFMTNAWDFANYMLLFGIAYLIFHLYKHKISLEAIYKTAVSVLIVLTAAVVTVLPFIVNFESIAEGVNLTHTKTPLWQLAILWGFPGVLTLIFLLYSYLKRRGVKIEDLIIISLLFAGWVLIAIPEFIFVKDIYIASHYRANTMFKLTYQAFVMFYLTSGYIAVSFIKYSNKIYWKIPVILFFIVLFGSLLRYPKIAVDSYYGELKVKKGLNGETWLSESRPDTMAAINWLRTNTSGATAILEAPGDSYTEFNVISSYTGLPTVSGWFVHEWLWRGTPDAPQERVNDIVQIYTTPDNSLTRSILRKYAVKYVIVGDFEREKYPELVEDKFNQIGKEVFSSETTKIYQIN